MDVISMHDAKSMLSQLVRRAANGERIRIGAYGKAEAELVPVSSGPTKRIGVLKGKFEVPEDFDAPLPADVLDAFEGKHE
ncbi:type II toxin-antitoxin system Phd/YefM family antitoxin [Trinickia mobilis]|uniref:type II toxin-antitoxin system Phd/YefM family antitoxin n=1 Tax=Trinickia mobilis TaxID=2816356 RepID=UPI001A8DD5F7|nr:type II toxin-antitoxin system Phd/YefM family antitoxin [Trinickia mobilis]